MKTRKRVRGNMVNYDPMYPERTRFEVDPNGDTWAFCRGNGYLNGFNILSEQLSDKHQLQAIPDDITDPALLLQRIIKDILHVESLDLKDKKADVNIFEKEKEDNCDKLGIFDEHPCPSLFELYVYGSLEDQLAVIILRLLGYVGSKKIDIEWFLNERIKYNQTRAWTGFNCT